MLHWHSAEVLAAVCFVLVLVYVAQDVFRHWPYPDDKWDMFWFLVSCVVALRYLASGRRADRDTWQQPTTPGDALHRRVALVTGSTSGVGLEVAKGLAAAGYTLVLPGTQMDRLARVARTLGLPSVTLAPMAEGAASALPPSSARVILIPGLDLANLDSVRTTARAVNGIAGVAGLSLVVHCAATLKRHYRLVPTSSGASSPRHESMLAVNVLGLMLLNELLMPNLRQTAETRRADLHRSSTFPSAAAEQRQQQLAATTSRIVIVASCCHTYLGLFETRRPSQIIADLNAPPSAATASNKGWDYSIFAFVGVYGLSKLCSMFYCDAVARRIQMEQLAAVRAANPRGGAASSSIRPPTLAVDSTGYYSMAPPPPLLEVCCCHPGIILSGLYRDLLPGWLAAVLYYPSLLVFKTCAEGAETVLHCCRAQRIIPGGYYVDCRDYGAHAAGVCSLSKHALDTDEGHRVIAWALAQIKAHLG